MKTIPLTQGKIAIVDDEDYEFLSQWRWHAKLTRGGRWYASRCGTDSNGKQKTIDMHRVLCSGKEIDHRDGNGLNNQKENLRSVSHSFNIFNSKRVSKSGVRGVQRRPNGRWLAQINCKGIACNLGIFDSLEEAKEARRKAEIKFFGEIYEPKQPQT